MSRKDSAAVESFFSLFRKDRAKSKVYETSDKARAEILDYIECFYAQKEIMVQTAVFLPMNLRNVILRS